MSSQRLTSDKSLLSSICSWYSLEEVLEETNKFLELSLEERGDFLLILFIFISEGLVPCSLLQ